MKKTLFWDLNVIKRRHLNKPLGLRYKKEFFSKGERQMKIRIFFVLVMSVHVWAGNVQTIIAPEEEKLVKAVEEKNVEEMLKAEAGSDFKRKHYPSVLHWAIQSGKLEVVKMVLEKIKAQGSFVDCARYKVDGPVLLATIQHENSVRAVTWSPDGKNVCTECENKTVLIWNAAEKKVIGKIQPGVGFSTAAWSPDGSNICTRSRATVQVWNVREKKVIGTIQHRDEIFAVSWSPDGSNICTGSYDYTAQVWNVVEKRVIGTIEHKGKKIATDHSISSVAWGPDGTNICLVSHDKIAQIWNVAEKKVIGIIQHGSCITAVAWRPRWK